MPPAKPDVFRVVILVIIWVCLFNDYAHLLFLYLLLLRPAFTNSCRLCVEQLPFNFDNLEADPLFP